MFKNIKLKKALRPNANPDVEKEKLNMAEVDLTAVCGL